MEIKNQDIKCSIFCDTKAIIKNTEAKVKETRSNKEKQCYMQDILLEVRALLSCSYYNTENPDCLTCRSISQRYIQEYKYLAKDLRKKSLINK